MYRRAGVPGLSQRWGVPRAGVLRAPSAEFRVGWESSRRLAAPAVGASNHAGAARLSQRWGVSRAGVHGGSSAM